MNRITAGTRLLVTALLLLVSTSDAYAAEFGDLAVKAADLKILSRETGFIAPVSSSEPVPNEFAQFQGNLSASNGICKSAQVRLKENATLADVAGLSGILGRYLRQLPYGRLALIDEVGVKLGLATGGDTLRTQPAAGEAAATALGVSLTASMEGRSSVMRPLDTNNYCRELKTLVKLYKVKTVLPLNAGRIKGMARGEIWKLPMSFRYGFGAGVGASFSELMSVTLGGSVSGEMKPSVSLYRMEHEKLRLRIRLDNILVKSAGVSGASFSIPAGTMGLPAAGDQLTTLVSRTLAGKINDFIAVELGYKYSRFQGKQLLLEFIIDPTNDEQLAGLLYFLRGDFGVIKRFMELGLAFRSFAQDDEAFLGAGELSGLSDQATAQLGTGATFAGSNHYSGTSHTTAIAIPVLHKRVSSRSSAYNRYQSLNRNGETLHVRQEAKASNGTSLLYTKHNTQSNVYVLNRESSEGKVTRPALFYQKHEGYIQRSDGAARKMVDNANDVLKYAGTQGNGTSPEFAVPASLLFPAAEPAPGADPEAGLPAKRYESAIMSFKLAIAEGGIQEILLAPPKAIMKAYLNMMREVSADIIDKVMELFTVDAKGIVTYDSRKVGDAVAADPADLYDGGTNPLEIVRTLAYTATRVIADIAGIREEADWKAQSEKLSKVTAGSNRSGLKYEEFLKVFVQLVDRRNLSAEVYVQTNKKVKGEKDYTEMYRFFNDRDNNFDKAIADVSQMRNRFAAPSNITD